MKKTVFTAATMIITAAAGVGVSAPANAIGFTETRCTSVPNRYTESIHGDHYFSGANYWGCARSFKVSKTGTQKISIDISTGAKVSSSKSGYARWSIADNAGRTVCGGYVHPSSKVVNFNCSLKTGWTYRMNIGLLNYNQSNAVWFNITNSVTPGAVYA